MSFVLLLTVLATFEIRADQANEQALSVHFEDLANRVSNAVLGAVQVGVQRAASESTAPSDELVYYEQLRIPTQIRGQQYQITLSDVEVTITAQRSGASETAPLFNLQVPSPCTDEAAVCQLSGTATSSQGFVLVKYEYKRGGAALAPCNTTPRNCITIG